MSVYKHHQTSRWSSTGKAYQGYRVVRSVCGRTIQKYFPNTPQGKADAEEYDALLAKHQKEKRPLEPPAPPSKPIASKEPLGPVRARAVALLLREIWAYKDAQTLLR